MSSKAKYPKAWLSASSSKSEVKQEKKKLEARAKLDMSEQVIGNGLCPVSGKPMVKMIANGKEVWVSVGERIALPVKD